MMDAKENGAYSVYPVAFACPDNQGFTATAGLTKREAFAMAAMQGLLANSANQCVDMTAEDTAECAVTHADALLAELSKDSA